MYQFYRNSKDDAAIINSLGKIRGSIQRYVKLILVKDESLDVTEVERTVNELISQYENDNIPFLESIKTTWSNIKELSDKYLKDSNHSNRQLLINESEKIWETSENLVRSKQYSSENDMVYLLLPVAFLTLEFFVGIGLLYIVKKYVYDNLESITLYDLLTDVYSRRYFFELLKGEISKAQRKEYMFSVIMFDIDHFKKVNDTYGHDKGDYVLKTIADIVKSSIRKADALSRIGGEEFTILLPDTNIDKATALAERVRRSVEDYKFDVVGRATISLGVTEFKADDSSDTLFKRVDEAMYLAKNSGRNCVKVNSGGVQ
ncbi:MAG: GGDEF domain-containing protein [Clostridiaceae bacterium]|nr:GGDEF domain-containing protein [Clostridiaceae bacterium]